MTRKQQERASFIYNRAIDSIFEQIEASTSAEEAWKAFKRLMFKPFQKRNPNKRISNDRLEELSKKKTDLLAKDRNDSCVKSALKEVSNQIRQEVSKVRQLYRKVDLEAAMNKSANEVMKALKLLKKPQGPREEPEVSPEDYRDHLAQIVGN